MDALLTTFWIAREASHIRRGLRYLIEEWGNHTYLTHLESIKKFPIVELKGTISKDTLEDIEMQLQVMEDLKVPHFHLLINSQGGEDEIAFHILELLERIDIPFTTIAWEECSSAATILFLASERRIAKATTTFLWHTPRTVITLEAIHYDAERENQLRTQNREEALKKLLYYQTELQARYEIFKCYYMERLGMTEDQVRTLLLPDSIDSIMDADFALEYGIATQIIENLPRD